MPAGPRIDQVCFAGSQRESVRSRSLRIDRLGEVVVHPGQQAALALALPTPAVIAMTGVRGAAALDPPDLPVAAYPSISGISQSIRTAAKCSLVDGDRPRDRSRRPAALKPRYWRMPTRRRAG